MPAGVFILSLLARDEWGESRRERGHPKTGLLLSPALSSLLRREEREKRADVREVPAARRAQISGVSPMGQMPAHYFQAHNVSTYAAEPSRSQPSSWAWSLSC